MSTWESRLAAAKSEAKLYWVTMVEGSVEKTPRVPFVPSQYCAVVRITQAFRCDAIVVFERYRDGEPLLVRRCWGDDLRHWPGEVVTIALSGDGRMLAR
jgi:hypothetical protein